MWRIRRGVGRLGEGRLTNVTSPLPRRALLLSLPLLGLAACSDGGDPATGVRDGTTVDTTLGEVTVPRDPTAIVVIEGRRDLDIVLALGLALRGYPYEEAGSHDLPSPLADELAAARSAGAEELFLADEINIESIAASAPDLIISRAEDVEPILEDLRAIAPVLAIGDQDTSTWQDDLRLVAGATGSSDRAEELVTAYDERVAALREQYATVLSSTTFVPMSYNGEGAETRPNRLLSLVLQDLGAQPSTAFATAIDGGESEYSPEQLVQGFGDAGAIVALVNDPDTWAQLQADPLFQQLPAVQAGHVVRSDRQTHEGASLTAQASLDVVEQLLATF